MSNAISLPREQFINQLNVLRIDKGMTIRGGDTETLKIELETCVKILQLVKENLQKTFSKDSCLPCEWKIVEQAYLEIDKKIHDYTTRNWNDSTAVISSAPAPKQTPQKLKGKLISSSAVSASPRKPQRTQEEEMDTFKISEVPSPPNTPKPKQHGPFRLPQPQDLHVPQEGKLTYHKSRDTRPAREEFVNNLKSLRTDERLSISENTSWDQLLKMHVEIQKIKQNVNELFTSAENAAEKRLIENTITELNQIAGLIRSHAQKQPQPQLAPAGSKRTHEEQQIDALPAKRARHKPPSKD